MKLQIVILLLSIMILSSVALNIPKSFAQESLSFSDFQRAYGSRKGDPRWNADLDLNKDGVIDIRDVSLFCHNFPLILNVSTNLFLGNMLNPDDGYFVFLNATVKHANRCVLSYMYVYYGNFCPLLVDSPPPLNPPITSEWINETMTVNRDYFNGTIDSSSMPGSTIWKQTYVYFKIYAINGYVSSESATNWFVKFTDP